MGKNRLIVLFFAAILAGACDTGLNSATSSGPPDAPVLRSPANLGTDEPNAVSLAWDEVEGAEYYHVQVSRTPGFVSVDVEANPVLRSTFDVKDLEMNVPYYWRVRAGNEMGVGAWSTDWTFTATKTAHTPARPTLVDPPDQAESQPTEIQFRWDAAEGATTYQIEVSLDPFFNTTFASLDGIPATSQYIFGLVKTYTYYWRVRAYNPAGYGIWSPVRYVIIEGIVGIDG